MTRPRGASAGHVSDRVLVRIAERRYIAEAERQRGIKAERQRDRGTERKRGGTAEAGQRDRARTSTARASARGATGWLEGRCRHGPQASERICGYGRVAYSSISTALVLQLLHCRSCFVPCCRLRASVPPIGAAGMHETPSRQRSPWRAAGA